MVRIRFVGKKRGDRSTGSRVLGSFGTMVFFLVFLLAGCVFFVVIVYGMIIPEWRVNHEFAETSCRVLEKRIGTSRGDDSTTYRPEIHIAYKVHGQRYEAWTYDINGVYTGSRKSSEAIIEQFAAGQEYRFWYDPRDPRTAVLVRGYTWFPWLMLLLPGVFVLVGGGGLVYGVANWGKSTERRAVLARQTRLDVFERSAAAELPHVPSGANLTNSPGTTLAYRLPTSSPGWTLLGVLAACLFWNGIVAVFVTLAVQGHLAGEADWFLTLFLIPFVAVGLFLVYTFCHQLLIATGIGPTIVEISEHPLLPGGYYELFLSQSGRLAVNSLRVLLVCEEEATYRQGTNTRTATERVFEEEIFRREGIEIHAGMPLESRCEFQVPDGAMHSFEAAHNRICWKVVVEGDVARWPDFERTYTVQVYPVGGTGERA